MNNTRPGDRPHPDVRAVRSVLFVCLGNICRSPLAQGLMEHHAAQRGVRDRLTIESCGTGAWHVGNPPDPRTLDVAQRNGVRLRSRARQLAAPADFERFDLLLAMDRQNLAAILRQGCPPSKALLFRTFDPTSWHAPEQDPWNLEVPDPYHGGPAGFEDGFAMVHRTTCALLDAMFAPDATARS